MVVGPGLTLNGRYALARVVGRGGMGAVYEGTDLVLERKVAVKILERALAGRGFSREAKIAARLDHPAIASVYDFGEADGVAFIVMPLLEGQTLRDELERGPMDLPHALQIAADVADALAYSHERGVIHRDIKPENIMVKHEPDGTVTAKVMDFGIAKLEAERASATLIGTPQYLAPEQALGLEVDGRSDLYALGAVLFEMIAGQPPVTGATVVEVIKRVVTEPAPSLSSHRPDVEPALATLVGRCLAQAPHDRPASARVFLDELRAAAPHAVARMSIPAAPRSARGWGKDDVALLETQLDGMLLGKAQKAAAPLARSQAVTIDATDGSDALRAAELSQRLGHADEALAIIAQQRALGELPAELAVELDAIEINVLADLDRHEHASAVVAAAERRVAALNASAPGARRAICKLSRARGNLALARGANREALDAFDAALDAADKEREPFEQSIALFNAADVRARLGQHARALELARAAREAKQQLDDRWGLAYVCWLEARIAFDGACPSDAERSTAEGLALAARVGDPRIAALLGQVAGAVLLELDRSDEAEARLVRAYEDARRSRSEAIAAGIEATLARSALANGQLPRARQLSTNALFRAGRADAKEAGIAARIAVMATEQPGSPTGLALAEEASQMARELGDPYRALEVEAFALELAGDEAATSARFDRVLDEANRLGCTRLIARVALSAARAAVAAALLPRAQELAEMAATALAELGALRRLEEASALLRN